jgi:Protein of unknown function (DUF2934)
LQSLLADASRSILKMTRVQMEGWTPMAVKSKTREPRSEKTNLPNNIEERIRQRAYELYEQRGKVDGFALDDWLQAEAEMFGARKQRKAKAAKASE